MLTLHLWNQLPQPIQGLAHIGLGGG
jgi:hypothetical protein